MKRIVLTFMSTLSALVLLFGYHTSTSSKMSAASETVIVAPAPATTTGAAAGSGAQASAAATAPPVAGSSTTTSASTAATPSPAATAAPSSAAGSSAAATAGSSSTAAAAATSTVTGDEVQTRWGPVQVQLTLQGSTITAVDVVEYPTGNNKDRQINARAVPVLVSETLNAQNAQIDMVSGATVTSDGYVSSLQSALDKAGL